MRYVHSPVIHKNKESMYIHNMCSQESMHRDQRVTWIIYEAQLNAILQNSFVTLSINASVNNPTTQRQHNRRTCKGIECQSHQTDSQNMEKYHIITYNGYILYFIHDCYGTCIVKDSKAIYGCCSLIWIKIRSKWILSFINIPNIIRQNICLKIHQNHGKLIKGSDRLVFRRWRKKK